MATGKTLEELHSELTCSICKELFNEPVILECGDHFCRNCISQLWGKNEGSFSCPRCSALVERSLRPNLLLTNVVDSVRRSRAEALHASLKETKCEEHREELKLFCEDDQRAICVVCGCSREHKTHNVIPIKEAFQTYKVLFILCPRLGDSQSHNTTVCHFKCMLMSLKMNTHCIQGEATGSVLRQGTFTLKLMFSDRNKTASMI